jgi:xylulokinase
MFRRIHKILGRKTISFQADGQLKTDFTPPVRDHDLRLGTTPFIQASGVPSEFWPEIVPSTHVLGDVRADVAASLGLNAGTRVVCGGVDNSCMALGAKNTRPGRVYTSLGSSAWIAVSAEQPVLDKKYKPFVFAHVIPGMFTSAVSIFSAGTSFTWV